MSSSPAIAPTWADRVPPQGYFVVSAVFHYLGPAFAVLLFAHVAPLGVAWLRIASAAVIFAIWRRPWRYFLTLPRAEQGIIVALGLVLAVMNSCFYEAIARLPLGTVGAIEFLGPIGLAAAGLRTPRNIAALIAAAIGVYILTDVRIAGTPLGFLFAFVNCALFVLYIVLGHRIASGGSAAGIDRLGAAMLIAAVFALPFGISDALPALTDPVLLGAAIGVGVFVVGHSLYLRSACDGAPAARNVRAVAVIAACDRITHRALGSASGAVGDRSRRHHAGDRRRRAASRRAHMNRSGRGDDESRWRRH
jgi:inner membrane transporter RhtA